MDRNPGLEIADSTVAAKGQTVDQNSGALSEIRAAVLKELPSLVELSAKLAAAAVAQVRADFPMR